MKQTFKLRLYLAVTLCKEVREKTPIITRQEMKVKNKEADEVARNIQTGQKGAGRGKGRGTGRERE